MDAFALIEDSKNHLANGGDDLPSATQIISADGVAYRVVQVSDNGLSDGNSMQAIVTAGTNTGGTTILPFNGDSLSPHTQGQFYLMMSSASPDVIQPGPQRIILNSSSMPKVSTFTNRSTSKPVSSTRDERRRATHNEVERRRRDKINLWIERLSKIIPECHSENSSQNSTSKNQAHLHSKGGILSKACDYIAELKDSSDKVPQLQKENDRLQVELELLRQKFDQISQENEILRGALAEAGIEINIQLTDSGTSLDDLNGHGSAFDSESLLD